MITVYECVLCTESTEKLFDSRWNHLYDAKETYDRVFIGLDNLFYPETCSFCEEIIDAEHTKGVVYHIKQYKSYG